MVNRKRVCVKSNGFTLVELLVVLGIIAIVSVVLVTVLNPVELMKRARDANRLSDLHVMNKALSIYNLDKGGNMGNVSTTYISIPDPAATTTAGTNCASLGLPATSPDVVYHCPTQSNYRNTDGTGWIPVNFDSISSKSPLGNLPVDPVNTTSTSNYYTYNTRNGNWEINATTESVKNNANAQNDGGDNPLSVEVGTNLTIAPPPAGHGTALFTTPGSGIWTAPTGVFSVFAEVWAGGGSGGPPGSNNSGGGGAGGGYSAVATSVTPGTTYDLYVGAGGIGFMNTAGEDSWFSNSSVVLSKGGGEGGGGSNGAGGTAGVGAIGTTLFNGGNGAAGVNASYSGGGGGGAGSAGNGSAAVANAAGSGGSPDGGAGGVGRTGYGSGNNGSTLGGGGSGGRKEYTGLITGGSGARGQVKLTW